MDQQERPEYEITDQDMIFLRALAARKKIQVGVDLTAAYTVDCKISPATGFIGNLVLVFGLVATGYLLWSREWGFAFIAVIGTGVLANVWRSRSAQKMRIRALMDADVFAPIWNSGSLTIRLPEGMVLSRTDSIFHDLRVRFPEVDAEFPNQA